MKGYYTAKALKIGGKPRLQVEAGQIHGVPKADAVFDIWAGLSTILDPPLYTCRAIKVGTLRTTLEWQGDVEPPQAFIAKPQKSTLPTLRYHASEEFKAIFTPLLESQKAQNLSFCLMETTKELADVSFSTTSDGSTYQILAAEELEHRPEAKKLESLNDIWELSRCIASYYHYLRQDNPFPINIQNTKNETQSFKSMFNVEVYALEDGDEGPQPIGPNLNLNHTGGVRILVDGEQNAPAIYGFKITNASTFNVYPHLFYFNSYELSISQSLLSSPELADGR
jgi:hypothetical protein